MPVEPELTDKAKGRDALTGLPRVVEVTSTELCEAIREPLQDMLDMVQQVLENTPPELAGDIIQSGICLTGGLSRLRELPELLSRHTGVPCHVAENPAQCVAIGAGKALQYASAFSAVYDLGNYAYRLSDNVTN